MKVLIVDDSATDTQHLRTLCEKRGYSVITADSGEAGVETAKAEKPDLVLMDVVMPGLNGFQATRAITKADETKHIPVIIVSTKNQETDKVWGKRQGAADFITKPVTAEVLYPAIDTATS